MLAAAAVDALFSAYCAALVFSVIGISNFLSFVDNPNSIASINYKSRGNLSSQVTNLCNDCAFKSIYIMMYCSNF